MLKDLKRGGTFLLNSLWSDDEIGDNLPAKVKRDLAKKNIKFYVINAWKIAEDIGLGNRINMVMQAAFFKLTGVIPIDDAVEYLKEGIDKAYKKKRSEHSRYELCRSRSGNCFHKRDRSS